MTATASRAVPRPTEAPSTTARRTRPRTRDALFIADYNRRWIRYLTFDAQGRATVNNFARETANGPVQILQGPDTNLYVVVLNASASQIRRIRYIAGGNTPPTAQATAAPTIGVGPLTVAFSSQGSYDPDAQALSYAWTFGDGGTSTQQNPTHVYNASGTYTARLTVTELTSPFASRTADVVITVGNEPPLATITTPANGTRYKIGDVISYSGTGTAGGVPIAPANLAWDLRLHHNEHLHFNALPNGASGSFEVIEHGDTTYYDLCLTVTSPGGSTDTQCIELLPVTTELTLATAPPGLFVNYEDEGITQGSPLIIHPVVGSDQTVSVPLIQGGYTFAGWADGEPSTSHPFIVTASPATYTANYVNTPPVAVATGAPVSGNVPLTVAFTGSGSYDPEFATLAYQWAFGDGATSTQADVSHTYTAAGTYAAVLTVTDQLNGTASKTVSITVNALCGNGQIESGEACDGGACCTATCQFAAAGTVCRGAASACDAAETCSGSSAACPADVVAANGTSCSDGNVCNGAETCQGGTCTSGTPPVCNDNNACTDDTCSPSTGCAFTNNTAPCDDGVACTTDVCSGGACQGTSTCVSGGSCNETTGTCDPPAGGYRVWPSDPTPAVIDAGPDGSVELGTKFRSDVAGYITGIRFYKSAANLGPHAVSLWNQTGARLGGTTVNLGNAVGWQDVPLPTAIQIQANTTYVASYHAPFAHYSGTLDFFTNAGVDTPPLHALKTGVSGGNGVYAYGSTSVFPNQTYRALNYWVDVMFSPAPPPTLTGIAVTPSGALVETGATQQYTATGLYSNGSMQNLNAQVTWASSASGVASISASGFATAVAPGTATISATLGAMSGSTSLSVQAAGTVSVTTTSLGVGVVGQAYGETLAATGGTPPYSWSVTNGTLPAGLTLNAGTGVISGTPTTPGISTVTVRVTAGAQTATRGFTISVGTNEIVAENALTGNPATEWDVAGAGDESIQGFATEMSVAQGGTIAFKVDTPATSYRIDIYRLGYYGGLGARRVATVQPSAALPQAQPPCLSQPATGLLDCGNWGVSGSWHVPAGATSGVYVAKLVRMDPEDGRASHVPFIVRDDDGGSDVLFQVSDTTWQAYNAYGGASLYVGSSGGRAVKVSYNRPFTTRCCSFPNGSPPTYLFNNEYPMVRWLERNGYDVSYFSGIDTDRLGAELLEHRLYMPVGHDEYWSGAQRTNVEAARAAGVNIAIFSGNHAFWKTRWETSIDGTGTPYRTLVCYKETEAGAKTDPMPGVWTGTWRDPRFGPPRRRSSRERAQRAHLHGERHPLRRTRGAGQRREDAFLAQYGSRIARGGSEGGVPDRHPGNRVGRGSRQRVPASGPRPAVHDHRRERAASVGLREDVRHRYGDAPSDAVPASERRAGVRRRDHPVALGPRRAARLPGPAVRRSHEAGDGEPAGRHARAAGHAPVGSRRSNRFDGHDSAERDDHFARGWCECGAGRHRHDHRHGERRRRPRGRRGGVDRRWRHLASGDQRPDLVELRLDRERNGQCSPAGTRRRRQRQPGGGFARSHGVRCHADPELDRGDSERGGGGTGCDTAVHGHRHVLGRNDPEPHHAGGVGLVRHERRDDQRFGPRDHGGVRARRRSPPH